MVYSQYIMNRSSLTSKNRSSRPSAESTDVLAIGDTMLDVFIDIDEARVECSIDKQRCEITFPFGEKIPVKSVTRFPGAGNASNAAIGARRLGLSSAILATVGDDEAGRSILTRWKQEGVDTRLVRTAKNQATNYSSIITYKGERTIFVHHEPYDYTLPKRLPVAKRLYYTSLGQQHLALEQALLTYLDQHPQIRVTFQPGTHQLRRLARGTQEILKRTDILVMNKEEAELFLEQPAGAPIAQQLERLLATGCRIAVITDGEHGSHAISQDGMWSCASFPVPSVERTGAGDSYATAFTWAIDKGYTIPQAMLYGTANAALVIQHIGPQDGLGDRQALDRMIKKFATITPLPLAL